MEKSLVVELALEELAALKMKSKMSYPKLAPLLGFHPHTFTKWARGSQQMTARNAAFLRLKIKEVEEFLKL